MYDFGDNKSVKGFLELILCYFKKKTSFSKRNYIEFERGLESTRIYTERSSVPGCQIISLKRRKVQCKSSANPKSAIWGISKETAILLLRIPKGSLPQLQHHNAPRNSSLCSAAFQPPPLPTTPLKVSI